MIKLEKGAKVKVRLHTGEVVEAEYCGSANRYKSHWVYLCGNKSNPAIASSVPHCGYVYPFVRFVGNPCVLLHEGVSV